MEKKEAIKIINQSAKLFQQNFEGKDYLFVYKRTDEKEFKILQTKFYDYNFQHLTGTKLHDGALHEYAISSIWNTPKAGTGALTIYLPSTIIKKPVGNSIDETIML